MLGREPADGWRFACARQCSSRHQGPSNVRAAAAVPREKVEPIPRSDLPTLRRERVAKSETRAKRTARKMQHARGGLSPKAMREPSVEKCNSRAVGETHRAATQPRSFSHLGAAAERAWARTRSDAQLPAPSTITSSDLPSSHHTLLCSQRKRPQSFQHRCHLSLRTEAEFIFTQAACTFGPHISNYRTFLPDASGQSSETRLGRLLFSGPARASATWRGRPPEKPAVPQSQPHNARLPMTWSTRMAP